MNSDQQFPEHYKRLYISFIRLACTMAFFGLLAGILFQESSRKVTYAMLGAGAHLESVINLALVHGHIFVIGVLIPLGVLSMLQFTLQLNGGVVSQRLTQWGGWLYHIGAGSAVVLMLYKGYHYVLSVRMGETNFATIEHHYFGGMELLKQIIYGVSHTALGVGLGILIVGIWRSLPKTHQPG